MANIKAGFVGIVGTVVLIMLELLLFPIALNFLSNMNSSVYLSSTDRTTLTYVPTLMVMTVIFTVLGGAIGSIYVAIKG